MPPAGSPPPTLTFLFRILDYVELFAILAITFLRPLYMREWVAPLEYNITIFHSCQVFAFLICKTKNVPYPIAYFCVGFVDALVLSLEIAVAAGHAQPSVGPESSLSKMAVRLTIMTSLFVCSLARFIDMVQLAWKQRAMPTAFAMPTESGSMFETTPLTEAIEATRIIRQSQRYAAVPEERLSATD